ncbi:LOW QUALITY PROTEIN: EKC/KEOPS complex subunit LAGE3 [Molossus nigricans]
MRERSQARQPLRCLWAVAGLAEWELISCPSELCVGSLYRSSGDPQFNCALRAELREGVPPWDLADAGWELTPHWRLGKAWFPRGGVSATGRGGASAAGENRAAGGRRRSGVDVPAADAGLAAAEGQDDRDGFSGTDGAGGCSRHSSACCASTACLRAGRRRRTHGQKAGKSITDIVSCPRRHRGMRWGCPQDGCVGALSVPFPSPLEADIARGSLAPDTEPHREVVRKALTVSGSILAVSRSGGGAGRASLHPGAPFWRRGDTQDCWRAEDSPLLRTSIISFLDQLSVVMRTMQRFGPPLPR